jgi:DNA-binding XRE family transcriptional regulator
MSQESAGQLLGISRDMIYRIERGRQRPGKSLMRKILKAFRSTQE